MQRINNHFKIKPPLPTDNSLDSVCERLDYLQERLDFFKDDTEVRQSLELTYTKEISALRAHKHPEKNLSYLMWFTNYLGWKR